jgi:riboflavin biosynthesis pyrimidine reductase
MTIIDRLWPEHGSELSDDQLVTVPDGPWLRVNFISSIDGAATADGLSGGLGTPADKRVFELLRRTSDAVLVGAGTVRSEGYGPMRVSEDSAAWRSARGLPPHPVFVIVSGSLDLDPTSRIFTEAPVTPIIVTLAGHDASAFAGLADVIVAGDGALDIPLMLGELRHRGLAHILNEGGPSLFTALLAAGAVDELRLTVSPVLVAGGGKHITAGQLPHPVQATLAEVQYSDGTLLMTYRF